MINPLNSHYSFTNPASIYDEEALTALELAGRTAAKTNEVVKDQNALRNETETHLENQDKTIDDRMNQQDNTITNRLNQQDNNITHIRTVTVPQDVSEEVQRQITNGTFDGQIDKSLNNLNERVDNLLGSVTQGTSTLDAEVIDLRVDANGVTHTNAGSAVRTNFNQVFKNISVPVTKNPNLIVSNNTFTLTEENGFIIFEGTINTSSEHAGFSLNTHKTVEELIGKKILMHIAECPDGLIINPMLTKSGGSWQYTIGLGQVYQITPPQIIEKIVPDSSTFTGNAYLTTRIDNPGSFVGKTIRLKICFHIIDTNITSNLMSNVAYYALNHPKVEYVPNAGFTGVAGLPFQILITGNTGTATLNNNTVTITTKDANASVFYSLLGVNVTDFIKNMKKVYIEQTGRITNICLCRTQTAWSQVIKNLSPGWNDLTTIDWSNEPHCYFVVGTYGYDNETGSVTPYFVGDNKVIASSLTNPNMYTTKEEVQNMIDGADNYITCWGDSLTAGGGWTTTLQTLSGYTVYNGGTGGENARTITARQGADVMLINNVTIPADTTPVQLADYNTGLTTQFGYKATPLLQGGAHVNPVSINGILGTLKFTGSAWNDTSGVWTFTRQTAGEQVIIDRPTPIVTAFDRDRNKPHLMVIFIGQNGGYDDLDDLVRSHKLMIEHSNAKHVVILGLSSGSASSRADYETRMIKEFGRYFISLRDYLSKYGLADAGLTPTEADTTAMSTGTVPPQLLADSVHYTAACKTVIGNMLYKKCCELNIF